MSGLISRLFGRSEEDNISDDQLLAIVNTGEKQGVFEKREKIAIKNILEFTDTTASEIMTPRTNAFILSANEKLIDVIEVIAKSDYSRIPIYHNKIDNITAVVHQKDIFKQFLQKNLSFKKSLNNKLKLTDRYQLSQARSQEDYHLKKVGANTKVRIFPEKKMLLLELN